MLAPVQKQPCQAGSKNSPVGPVQNSPVEPVQKQPVAAGAQSFARRSMIDRISFAVQKQALQHEREGDGGPGPRVRGGRQRATLKMSEYAPVFGHERSKIGPKTVRMPIDAAMLLGWVHTGAPTM